MNKFSLARFASYGVLSSAFLLTISLGKVVNAQPAQLNANHQFDGPELTVAKFHQAIQNRDFDSLDSYYCLAERVAAQALYSTLDSKGQNRALLDAYLETASIVNSIDMSQLHYETKFYDEVANIAVVAIVGPVIVESSVTGQSLVLPYREFSTFGRDWLRLINENGEWKLCYNLIDLPQSGVSDDNGGLVFQTNSRITTNLSVEPGDRVEIKASGSIRFGFFAGSGGPRGISFNPNFNYFKEIPHGQLIGRIKQAGMEDWDEWFVIAEGKEFTAQESGILEFAVNDTHPKDNVGKFRIEVIIDSAQE